MNYYNILEDEYIEPLWYPDFPDQWVETFGRNFLNEVQGSRFLYLMNHERISKDCKDYLFEVNANYLIDWSGDDFNRVCAYRILS